MASLMLSSIIGVCASLILPLCSLLLETSMVACMIDQCVAVDFRTSHSCYSLCLGTLLIDGGGVTTGGRGGQANSNNPKGYEVHRRKSI